MPELQGGKGQRTGKGTPFPVLPTSMPHSTDSAEVAESERVRRLLARMARAGKEILLLRKAISDMDYPDRKKQIALAEMVVLQRRRTRSIIKLLAAMGVAQPPRRSGDLLVPTSDDMYAVYRTADTSSAEVRNEFR